LPKFGSVVIHINSIPFNRSLTKRTLHRNTSLPSVRHDVLKLAIAIASRGCRRSLSGRTVAGFPKKLNAGEVDGVGALSLPEAVGFAKKLEAGELVAVGGCWRVPFPCLLVWRRAPLHFQQWWSDSLGRRPSKRLHCD
jgi:hypothetical protein